MEAWTAPGARCLEEYAALMAAARAPHPSPVWIVPAVETVRRAASDDAPAARLLAQGAVALLTAIGSLNDENRLAVLRAAGSLEASPAAEYLRGELAWRLEA